MLHRSRGTVYWPSMASDIKQIADMCETCQEMKPRNPPEPLRQYSDGDEPSQKIGLDLFEITGKHYLAVVDYYSNFIKIDLLTTMTILYQGPKIWNSLPVTITSLSSFPNFKKILLEFLVK